MNDIDDWCGLCGRSADAARCPNCDYSICSACRTDGRCLCGAPLGYDPKAEPRPTEQQCLEAVVASESSADGTVLDHLVALGFGEVPIMGQLERLYDANLIECGLSLRLPWLTEGGRARLQKLRTGS